MKRNRTTRLFAAQLCSIVLLASFVVASARPQTPTTAPANDDRSDTTSAPPFVSCFGLSFVPSASRPMPASSTRTNIDNRVMREFNRAWLRSGFGTNGRESVVLIFRMKDGSYTGKSQGFTNEYERFTFRWNPAARAIVHTHPNSCGPRPSEQDKRVADKYGVPNFTITVSGMYVYDPATKQTRKVLNDLDWLDPSTYPDSNWTQEMARSVNSSSHQDLDSLALPKRYRTFTPSL